MRTWVTLLAFAIVGCGNSSPGQSPGADAALDAPGSDTDPWADAPLVDQGTTPDRSPDAPAGDLAADAATPDLAADAPAPDAPAPDVAADVAPDAAPDLAAQDTGPLDLGNADLPADAAVGDMGADAGPPCTQVMGTPPLGLQIVETGFARPVDIQSPPGDPRIFIVEQAGTIWIIDGGATLPTPFLDLTSVVTNPAGNEQGLLGLAFHPNYASNGRFFVYYTDDPGGDIQVSEFAVSADPNVADPTESPVISIPHPEATNHDGGQLAFGPSDGYLYIAVGDGGNGCDTPVEDANSTMSLRGKLLRLDVDSAAPYAIPMDNPFAGSLSQANEIWAYGLRNPWRFSFDRETSDVYIADVGQGEWEEVDVQPAASTGGENYGWNDYEGSVCQDGSAGTSCTGSTCPAGTVPPTYEYPHAGAFCTGAITGGYVYRGCAMPGYHGTYFYADYCFGTVHSFVYSGGVAGSLTDWPSLDSVALTFGQDFLGELYIGDDSGTIYRIVPQ